MDTVGVRRKRYLSLSANNSGLLGARRSDVGRGDASSPAPMVLTRTYLIWAPTPGRPSIGLFVGCLIVIVLLSPAPQTELHKSKRDPSTSAALIAADSF